MNNLKEMNTQDLEKEVCRLIAVKKKNEEKIPMEELQTRYQKAYENLCDNLKTVQSELRTRYLGILRGLSEIMADSVYMDSEEKAAVLDERLNEEARNWNMDPLAKALYIGFYHQYSGKWNGGTQHEQDAGI